MMILMMTMIYCRLLHAVDGVFVFAVLHVMVVASNMYMYLYEVCLVRGRYSFETMVALIKLNYALSQVISSWITFMCVKTIPVRITLREVHTYNYI
jgi:hypothetical protein